MEDSIIKELVIVIPPLRNEPQNLKTTCAIPTELNLMDWKEGSIIKKSTPLASTIVLHVFFFQLQQPQNLKTAGAVPTEAHKVP
ncbi:hypothetical protein SLE2022_132230 [Rubroshorea leprosula]